MDTELRRYAEASGERRSYAHLCLESPPALLGRRLRWSVLRRHRRVAKPGSLAARHGRERLDRRLVGTGGCGWTAGIEHTRRRRCGRFRRGAALDRRVDRLQTSFAGSGQTLPVSREPGRRLLPPESVGATALRRQVGAPARELPPRGPRAAGLAREPRVNPLPNEPGRIARALLNLRVCVPGTRSGVGIRESMINRLIDHSNTRIRNEGAQF